MFLLRAKTFSCVSKNEAKIKFNPSSVINSPLSRISKNVKSEIKKCKASKIPGKHVYTLGWKYRTADAVDFSAIFNILAFEQQTRALSKVLWHNFSFPAN